MAKDRQSLRGVEGSFDYIYLADFCILTFTLQISAFTLQISAFTLQIFCSLTFTMQISAL